MVRNKMKKLQHIFIYIVMSILFALAIVTVTDAQVDSTLCDTGIKVTQTVHVRQGGNILTVTNDESEQIFIIAIDYNRDGIYEYLVFDTDGNGKVDMQLEGGQATAEEVIWLYCQYIKIDMS